MCVLTDTHKVLLQHRYCLCLYYFYCLERTTPEIVQLITNILLDFRIDDIFDLYSDYDMEKFMRGNVDFAINTNQECLFIRDAVSSKIELISFDAIGVGNFNIKVNQYL